MYDFYPCKPLIPQIKLSIIVCKLLTIKCRKYYLNCLKPGFEAQNASP